MEKIKVNMSPNPLDVQTIHASQNDGEARQWEFELHNNGELIDTSSVTEQMFFKAYKGGTEQLLPENTSTPTTSPFLGDIKYPQGLLTDQEFLYRQSPTEKDGLAKITDIKGNTLVWNQLFKIYSPTTVTTNGVTLTTNVDGTVTLNGTATARTAFVLTAAATSNGLLSQNHIYYMAVCPKGGSYNTYFGGIAGLVIDTGNGGLWKYNYTWDSSSLRIDIYEGVTFNNVSFKPQYIDLTLLFGAEKAEEILAMGQTNGVAYFRSLFSLSYYSYNQGSLLSFNGTGIKTANADETEEHTINLPVSTYFPTGMKSAGSVYDELTESKAITRIGAVDLGSLTWAYKTSGSALAPYFYASFNGIKSQGAPSTSKANILCSKYQSVLRDIPYFVDKTICADGSLTEITQIQIKDSSYTDAIAFKNSLQGVYLYYELATPTETPITTASLVTENAEIPLSNEDGVLIGKCTEELSTQPGFIDAKIKLTDGDGDCYSNKIQLHVERKP